MEDTDVDVILSDLVAIAQFILEKHAGGKRVDQEDAVLMAELFDQLDESIRENGDLPDSWIV